MQIEREKQQKSRDACFFFKNAAAHSFHKLRLIQLIPSGVSLMREMIIFTYNISCGKASL